MDAFEKWRAEYGIEHPMYDRPNYRERFYASEAFRAGMRRAATLCEARFNWILDEPDMSYEADGARMCLNDILAEAYKETQHGS